MPHTFDPYFQLIEALRRKEQAQPSERVSIREEIKTVADMLLNQKQPAYTLDAAFAYYVSGYYARAFNLTISINDFSPDIPVVAQWLSLFFAKRFKRLRVEAEAILGDRDYSDEGIHNSIATGELAAALPSGVSLEVEVVKRILTRTVAECLVHFLLFVEVGDTAQLTKMQEKLVMCERLAVKTHDYQWWWRLVCLRFVMDEFAENSLWSCLAAMRSESELVTQYVEANYQRNDPVVELWRSQIESLPYVNDPERQSYCLKMPTGAGKTRVAELMILRFLMDTTNQPETKCVYIAPFRTLASEVEKTLKDSFDSQVSEFYGGYEIDPFDQLAADQTRIWVMTPEKLDGMLRQNSDLIQQIRLIIVDEGHMIGEKIDYGRISRGKRDRGLMYQMVVQRLVYTLKIKREKSARQGARLLLISGVLPNIENFAEWLTGDRKNAIELLWRPVEEPRFGVLAWDGKALIRDDTHSPIHLPPLDVDVQLDLSHEDDDPVQNNAFVPVVAQAAVFFAASNRTILFSASKKLIRSQKLLTLIDKVLQRQGPFDHAPLPQYLQASAKSSLEARLLEQGVAVHHADLPSDLRHEIEARIYAGKVQLVLASPTLAQGVNFPFYTMLLYGLEHERNIRISDIAFRNIVGRIGRPLPLMGTDDFTRKPEVWFLLNQSLGYQTSDEIYCEELLTQRDQFRVSNALFEFLTRIKRLWFECKGTESIATLVLNLAENDLSWIADDQERHDVSLLLELIDDHLIALSHEAKLNLQLEEVTKELIRLLQGAEILSTEDLAYIEEAVKARARFVSTTTTEKQRERRYLLGLPERDRSVIEAHQDELLEWYQKAYAIFTDNIEEGLVHIAKIMGYVSGLSIASDDTKVDDTRLPDATPTLFDLTQFSRTALRHKLFKAWIRGDDQGEVSKYLPQKPIVNFDKYREDVLERGLPWGVSTLGRFLSSLAQERGISLPSILEFLPSLIKYGVPNPLACSFVRLGLSRSGAVRIWNLHNQNDQTEKIEGINSLALSDFSWTRDTAVLILQLLSPSDIAKLRLTTTDKQRLDTILQKSSE